MLGKPRRSQNGYDICYTSFAIGGAITILIFLFIFYQLQTKTQADKAETKLGKDQHELIVEFENMLKTVITRPSLWVEERFQFLRNFCHTVANNGERFPTLMGDRNEEVPSESEEPIIHPT